MSFLDDMNIQNTLTFFTPSKDEAGDHSFDGFTPDLRPPTRRVQHLPKAETPTPVKDEAFDLTDDVITPDSRPTQRTVRPPVLVDEDSGLGMTPPDRGVGPQKTCNSDSQIFAMVGAKRSLFSLKRSSDGDLNGSITKRYRQDTSHHFAESIRAPVKALVFEDTEIKSPDDERKSDIMAFVDKLADEDMIGNGSQGFSLPTIPGKHADLKSITPETMGDILHGKYDDVINSYRIIDCRYPYEYDGGHIKKAENLYLREQVDMLLKERSSASASTSTTSSKRDIIIFHCEFSSERGPKLLRFLRSQDREMNKDNYPFLHFPEVYLLHDGYKAFYETSKEHCEPMSYTPMLHSSHTSDLRHFRAKSKSWCVGEKRRLMSQRLRF